MGSPLYISEDQVKNLLNWDNLIPAMEDAIRDISTNSVVQPGRMMVPIPSKEGVLLLLPAYSENKEALAVKLVTAFANNTQKGLPTVLGTILHFDPNTGKLNVIIEGTEITTMRTAAASVVATKYLHGGEKKILTIVGAGTQGRAHSLAMKHYFNFPQIRVWNRTPERAKKLCQELGPLATCYTSLEEAVRGADVIVTATHNAQSPLVLLDWVKEGAHINSVGAGASHHNELQLDLYKHNGTSIYVDDMKSAVKELKDLIEVGVTLQGEVGQIISKQKTIPSATKVTVFQSLGMAVEDLLASKVVYDEYIKTQNSSINLQ